MPKDVATTFRNMFKLRCSPQLSSNGDNESLECSSAKVSPDGKFCAIPLDTRVLIIENDNGTIHKTIQTQHTSPISDVCWSPDGQCVATASDDCSIGIIHVSLYGPVHRLFGHTAPVLSLCYNSRGNLLFSSSMDESIKIWDVLNGTLIKTISAHSDPVVSLDLPSMDSSILASGSYDGLIRIFDSHTGHCLKTLTYDKDWKSEDGVVPISQVKFSLNGKFLLVKSLDGVVKIWDCIRGDVVRTLKTEETAHLTYSCGMDFVYPTTSSGETPEQQNPLVVSGDEHGKVFCWEVATKKLLQVLDTGADTPIISIDCHRGLVCVLTLDGHCFLYEWEN